MVEHHTLTVEEEEDSQDRLGHTTGAVPAATEGAEGLKTRAGQEATSPTPTIMEAVGPLVLEVPVGMALRVGVGVAATMVEVGVGGREGAVGRASRTEQL